VPKLQLNGKLTIPQLLLNNPLLEDLLETQLLTIGGKIGGTILPLLKIGVISGTVKTTIGHGGRIKTTPLLAVQ